jgi:phosphoglycolate phosphatase-like HAD superfamily hydrolase
MTDTLLLFDIDGTLLDTRGAGQRAMRRVGQRLFGEHFTFEGVPFAGMLDPVIYRQAADRNRLAEADQHHERFRGAYLPELAGELERAGDDVTPCPGIHALLAAVRKHQEAVTTSGAGTFILGLLTGNYADAAPLKLRAVGIDPLIFTLNAFGDEAPTRPDLVALALAKFRGRYGRPIDPRRVFVIGDTEHDIDCAKAHGCVSLAVATGRSRAEELARHGPDAVFTDLTDAEHFLTHL